MFTVDICPEENGHFLTQLATSKRMNHKQFVQMIRYLTNIFNSKLIYKGNQPVYVIDATKEDIATYIKKFATEKNLSIQVA